MDTGLKKILFGIAAAVCLTPFVSSPIALAGGFLFTLLLGNPFADATPKVVNWLLKIAVVGLGFGMDLGETLKAGSDGFGLTVFSISLTLIAGYLIARFMGIQRKTGHLISSGTAICGGSAIAAVSPIIRAEPKDISIALGVVFVLNSIALFVFPPIGHLLGLTQYQFGLWSAIAIHDTSSVVGAALTYGDEALRVATTVKLARALWIIPISLLSVAMFKGKGKSISIPYFIFLFILAMLINTYLSLPEWFTTSVTTGAKAALVLTLFLIGAGLSLPALRVAGWKPMILGVSLWALISISSVLIIRWV